MGRKKKKKSSKKNSSKKKIKETTPKKSKEKNAQFFENISEEKKPKISKKSKKFKLNKKDNFTNKNSKNLINTINSSFLKQSLISQNLSEIEKKDDLQIGKNLTKILSDSEFLGKKKNLKKHNFLQKKNFENQKINLGIIKTKIIDHLILKEKNEKNCYFLVVDKDDKTVGYFSQDYCKKLIPVELCKYYEKHLKF